MLKYLLLYFQKIKKVLSKIYDKDIDFYASSLSFLSIFSFIPIILLVFYIFHFSEMFIDMLNQISTMIILFFPNNYSEDIVRITNKFFNMEGNLTTTSLIYVTFTSYLFLKDYKVILLRIGNNNYDFLESVFLYIKLIIFIPISIVIISLISFASLLWGLDVHNFFLMFIYIFIVYYASIKEASSLSIAQSSIVVTIILYILKLLFIYYFKYNHIYETLYGSISFVFFILLWIYVSWVIFLYGVKFIFYQDRK